jgi:hypothetical protein
LIAAHSGDYSPGLGKLRGYEALEKDAYKTFPYVMAQIENLINQYLEKKANPMQHVLAYSDLIAKARARLEKEEALSGHIGITLRVEFRNHSGEAEVVWALSHNYKDSVRGPDLMELIDVYIERWAQDEARTPLMISRS